MDGLPALSFVYVTAGSKADALAMGRVLVEERLAACINVFERMTSVYHWRNAIEESQEAVLIAKTRTSLVPAVAERIRSLHSYTCPCVVSWPLQDGNPDYLQWLAAETRGNEGRKV
jgi:periplasmic divalent cation tolerance protein